MIFGVEKKQWLLFMFIVLFHLRVVVKQIQIIIDYANMIGKSPSVLNMKIGNI